MNFFEEYFKYVGKTEAPNIFHRWCGMSVLSSIVGRDLIFPFGHKPIYANMYILLVGMPGARKSSAIGIGRNVLEGAGYKTFAKDRSSKERFFADMVKKFEEEEDLMALVMDAPSEVLISNGEFLDFIGQGDMQFLTALTNLWDNLPVYEHPKMNGKSIFIHKPTINILGGATVKGLGMAMPPEALGTGILSRLVLIHSDPTGRKIAFPEPVPEGAKDEVVETLLKLKNLISGGKTIVKSPLGASLLEKMYHNCVEIEDGRFADYAGRRFTHLIKTAMLTALSNGRIVIEAEDAMIANTVLYAAERSMPKALGEFGKSKYSDVANTIIEALNKTHKPLSHNEIWKLVSNDLPDSKDLTTVMKNLLTSEKIQVMTMMGKQGYMPLRREHREWDKGLLLDDYLTIEERR